MFLLKEQGPIGIPGVKGGKEDRGEREMKLKDMLEVQGGNELKKCRELERKRGEWEHVVTLGIQYL